MTKITACTGYPDACAETVAITNPVTLREIGWKAWAGFAGTFWTCPACATYVTDYASEAEVMVTSDDPAIRKRETAVAEEKAQQERELDERVRRAWKRQNAALFQKARAGAKTAREISMTIPPSVQRLLSMQKRWFNPDFDREFHAMLKMDRKAGSLCCWPMGFHWERLRDNDLPHPTLMEMLEASTITFELMADKALPIWCGRPESYSALALKAFLGEASSPGASPEACWAKYRERCAYIERLNGDAWRTARLAQRRWWYEDAA